MIGKVQRGDDIGGLMAYLFGPGKHNEHTDPHVVAHWTGLPEEVVPVNGDGQPNLAPAIADLKRDLKAAGLLAKPDTIWHCSVSIPADDGPLTDAQWREVAETVAEAVGLEDGELGAVRWIAVRHGLSRDGNDHIHIAATLAGRTDLGDATDRTFLRRDYAAIRKVCNDFEARWGLTVTSAGTGAAAHLPQRAELEIAARRGLDLPQRVRLERAVRSAAVASRDAEDFAARLAAEGITAHFLRPSEQRPGTWLGVTFSTPDYTTSDGEPVQFSGRTLAKDLTAPALQARWDARAAAEPRNPGGTANSLVSALADALTSAESAGDPTTLRAHVAAGADALWAATEAVEDERGGRWHHAADEAARAAREAGSLDAGNAPEITGLLDGLALLPRGSTKVERELAHAYAMFMRLLRAWAQVEQGEASRVAATAATRIGAATAPAQPAAGRPPAPKPAAPGRTTTTGTPPALRGEGPDPQEPRNTRSGA